MARIRRVYACAVALTSAAALAPEIHRRQALSSGAAAPLSGDVLQCYAGWAARALLREFEKDRFCQPYSDYRKELRSNKRPRDATVDVTPPPKVFTPQTLPRAGSAPSDPTSKPATSVATSVAAAITATLAATAVAASAFTRWSLQSHCAC